MTIVAWMRKRWMWVLGCVVVIVVGAVALGFRSVRSMVTIDVATTEVQHPFNRALFSWGEPDGMLGWTAVGLNAYLQTHPAGTYARQGVNVGSLCPMADGTCAGQALNYNAMFNYIGAAPNTTAVGKGVTPDQMIQREISYGETPQLLFLGRPDLAQSDPQAWANLVVRVLEHFDGSGTSFKPVVPAIEIWNEDNTKKFWKGTPEQYFSLFEVTAKTVHQALPKVLVGGPTVCCPGYPNQYGINFLQADAPYMNIFIFHDYSSAEAEVAHLASWVNVLKNSFHIADPKIMVTESDPPGSGYPKEEALLSRQFGLLPYWNDIVSWDEFHVGAYKQYGMINNNGTVIDKNYWPYWIFRDATGEQVQSRVLLKTGSGTAAPDVVSTVADSGQQVNTVIYLPPGAGAVGEKVRVNVALPSKAVWLLSVSALSPSFHGVSGVRLLDATTKYTGQWEMQPGEALSFTFRQGKALDAASPLINFGLAPAPTAKSASSSTLVGAGETLIATATIFNTTGAPITGEMSLGGLSTGLSGWSARAARPGSVTLQPGQSRTFSFTVNRSGSFSNQPVLDAQFAWKGTNGTSGTAMSVGELAPLPS